MVRYVYGLMAGVTALTSALPAWGTTGDQKVAAAPAQSAHAEADPTMAGHYYLSGVMETGSELLLKADGRFEWFISYGAVDQFAEGRWVRRGDTVTLMADQPSTAAPLFRLDERTDWNETAEERLLDCQYAERVDAVTRVCPWATTAVATSPPMLLDEHATPGATERTQAAEAKAKAIRARDAAGPALARAVADNAGTAEQEAAGAAMDAWYAALYDMEQAYRMARIEMPDIGDPALPNRCELPERIEPAALTESQWQRGIAVIVGDPAREMRMSRVGVTFIYGDGYRESGQTSNGGWAFAPLRKATGVTGVELALPGPNPHTTMLPMPLLTEGIQAILVDTRQLVTPPFQTMRLKVMDGALIPEDMPRGRYSRD